MSSVLEAVQAEVDGLPAALKDSPDAAICVRLASRIGSAEARELPALSRELRLALAALREAVKASGNRGDGVDELRSRRAARRKTG